MLLRGMMGFLRAGSFWEEAVLTRASLAYVLPSMAGRRGRKTVLSPSDF